MDIAIAQIKLGTHRLQRLEVQVNRARTDGTPPRQRDDRMSIARQHRPQHKDRGPHLAHDVIVGGMVGDREGRHRQNLATPQGRNL